MKSWLLMLLTLTYLSANANAVESWQVKLIKKEADNTKTVYEFSLKDDTGNNVNIPKKFKENLLKKLSQFTQEEVKAGEQLFTMSVLPEDDFHISISFDSVIKNKKQALFSCFQDWYMNLPSLTQRELRADLSLTENDEAGDEARELLGVYNNQFKQFLQGNTGECAAKYPNIAIEPGEIGFWYHIGFRSWYAGFREQGYTNFYALLDGTKEVFQAKPNKRAYLAEWLSQIKQRFEKDFSWTGVEQVLLSNTNTDSSTFMALELMKRFTPTKNVSDYFDTGNIGEDLSRDIAQVDAILKACYVNNKYVCDDYQNRFVTIDFISSFENFTFYISAEGN